MVFAGRNRWLLKGWAGLATLALALGGCGDPATGTFNAQDAEKTAAANDLRPGSKSAKASAKPSKKGGNKVPGAVLPKP